MSVTYTVLWDEDHITWRVIRSSHDHVSDTSNSYLPDADSLRHGKDIADQDAGVKLVWNETGPGRWRGERLVRP